jgi:hypothetical protein
MESWCVRCPQRNIHTSGRHGRRRHGDVLGCLAIVVAAHLMVAPVAAQEPPPPFLRPADPSCELTKINGLFADANAACPGFAQAQCPPVCALAMAPVAYGDCRNSIAGIIDQSEQVSGSPNGLAETVQRQTTACVSDNTPTTLAAAAAAAQGCAGGGLAGGAGRSQDEGNERVENEALLTAFAAADGSVCALAEELLAPPTAVSSVPLFRALSVLCVCYA